MTGPGLVRCRMWRWASGTGLERFELLRADDGWALRGTILALHDERPVEARYEVRCDRLWRTMGADVSVMRNGGERTLQVSAATGRWHANGVEQTAVRGCVDIDLSWTPSTNTLPIRRLDLGVGAGSGPVTAAWVRFPELTIEPLPQEYQRLGERRYHYSSRRGSFSAELDVDELGLVIDYGDIWRCAGGDGRPPSS